MNTVTETSATISAPTYNFNHEQIKEAERTCGPLIARNLEVFVRSFDPQDEKAATIAFMRFLLEAYNEVFSSITFENQQPNTAHELARDFGYFLLDLFKGQSTQGYAQEVAEEVYHSYGSVSHGRLGVPKIEYEDIYRAFTQAMLYNKGNARQTVSEHSELVGRLLDCFEYPKGKQ